MMLFIQQIIKAALFVTVLAALLFGVSGDIFWIDGWVYLGVFSGCSIINMIIMARHNPELLKERMQPGADAKSWDRVLAPLMALYLSDADRCCCSSSSAAQGRIAVSGCHHGGICRLCRSRICTDDLGHDEQRFFFSPDPHTDRPGSPGDDTRPLPVCASSGLRRYADVCRVHAVHAGLILGIGSGRSKSVCRYPAHGT